MPNIRGGLVHVPKPPPRAGDSFRRAASSAKQKVNTPFSRKMKSKINSSYGNLTSKPAKVKGKSRKFGATTESVKFENTDRRVSGALSGTNAATFGLLGGGTIGAVALENKSGKVRSNQAKIAANSRKIKRQEIGKRVHLITDVGTRGGKAWEKAQVWNTKRATMTGLGVGTAGGLGVGVLGNRKMNQQLARQKKTLAAQNKKLKPVQKSWEEFSKGPFTPKSQPQGQRKRDTRKGKYKAKPRPSKGGYVKAPLMRDKLTNPRWTANAAVNHPGNVAAGGALGGAAFIHGAKKNLHGKKRTAADTTEGGLIGGSLAHASRQGADYGAKAVGERQFKNVSHKGNYGPYKEGPHKATMNKYKRTAKGDPRTKAKMFDENFPKGVPSYRARRVGTILNKKPVAAGVVAGGAAVGAGAAALKNKFKKNNSVSAFGVDHG